MNIRSTIALVPLLAGLIVIFFGVIMCEPVLAYHTVEGIAERDDKFGSSLTAGDFNGDGFVDLAIDVPQKDSTINGQMVKDIGYVNVIYGGPTGLTEIGNQLWNQNSPGILEEAQEFDNFGTSLTAGDFNGDGSADLAIGVPGESVGTPNQLYAGATNVLYGSIVSGLTEIGNQLWNQDPAVIPDKPEGYPFPDSFGRSLAAGDFNNDGVADLAIGVPGENVTSLNGAGAVNVIYGVQGTGLGPEMNQIWHQESPGILEDAGPFERFGASLAAGDFNNDGVADLAIGVPDENVTNINGAGAVNVIYGAQGTGLTATNNQLWHQESPGILEDAKHPDNFGASLAAGDFNNDGVADLAIGVPHENVTNIDGAGAVNVIYGAQGTGLTATNNQLWHQESPGILEDVEKDNHFANSLAAGDFNNDGVADLAIGVPDEDVEITNFGNVNNAGAVNVMYGAQGLGLRALGNQEWHQDAPGIEGTVGEFNQFGASLAAGDFNNDGVADLAIGVPLEDLRFSPTSDVIEQAGAVNVIYGAQGFGLSAVDSQIWSQGPGP